MAKGKNLLVRLPTQRNGITTSLVLQVAGILRNFDTTEIVIFHSSINIMNFTYT